MTDLVTPATTSLIIPSYNMSSYVADAINSALAQTVPYSEIIVVDDGSTDDTESVLSVFDGWITLIEQENQGVSFARNTGFTAATGAFIAYLDADDLLLSDCLEKQLALHAQHPDTQFSDTYSRYFWCPRMTEDEQRTDHRWAHDFWKNSFPGHISTWFMPRETMEQVGPFEAGVAYSEDTDWRMRGKAMGLVARRLEQEVSVRRLHPTNATNKNRDGNIAGLMQAIRRHRARSSADDAEQTT